MITKDRHLHTQLAALMGQTVGVEKAAELIAAAARDLSFGESLTNAQCLEVLERIAAQPGLVGVSARFAKSRVLLRWGKE